MHDKEFSIGDKVAIIDLKMDKPRFIGTIVRQCGHRGVFVEYNSYRDFVYYVKLEKYTDIYTEEVNVEFRKMVGTEQRTRHIHLKLIEGVNNGN